MGRDEHEPTTGRCHDWFRIGLMMLDSLDTFLVMGMEKEYQMCHQWAQRYLSFQNATEAVSLFEIIIRGLGGLNSAYEITRDTLWLNHSIVLGDMLLQAFGRGSLECPPTQIYIGTNLDEKYSSSVFGKTCSPAELGTMQLEFRTLSDNSGDPKYKDAVDKCQKYIMSGMPEDKLVQSMYNARHNNYYGERYCIGGGVDSLYEMFIKNWVAWGKASEDQYLKESYEQVVESIYKRLVRREHGLTYVGEYTRDEDRIKSTMDHLACFFPGTLAVAALHGLGGGLCATNESSYMPRARELAKSCFAMTRGTKHGLGPEITDFSYSPPRPEIGQDTSFLRPEVVEALYYMDKLDPYAGDKYKKMGKIMWEDLKRTAQVRTKPYGVLSSVYNLDQDIPVHHDKLHSFVVAETYKYFFLLFDERPPKEGPLNPYQWVYSTEAHPVRIRKRS